MPAASIAFSPASAAASSKRIPSGHQRRSPDPGQLLEQARADVAAREDVGELLVDPVGGDDLGRLDRLHREDADVAVTLRVVAAHLQPPLVSGRPFTGKRPFRASFERRGRDLNPRSTFQHLRDFQSRSFGHSDTSPWPRQRTATAAAIRPAATHESCGRGLRLARDGRDVRRHVLDLLVAQLPLERRHRALAVRDARDDEVGSGFASSRFGPTVPSRPRRRACGSRRSRRDVKTALPAATRIAACPRVVSPPVVSVVVGLGLGGLSRRLPSRPPAWR